MRNLTATFLLLIVGFAALAKDEQAADSLKKQSFIALPYGNYTEETSWAAGIAANYYLWNKNALNRVSSFSLNATYTLNNQIILGLYNRYYFGSSYYLYGRAIFEKYPDYYFGIGNDNPESNKELFVPIRYHINLEPQKFINDKVLVGISLQTRRESIIEYDTISVLKDQQIAGSEPYLIHGLGGIFAIDTRDNNYYPSKGVYLKTAANYFMPILGSKYNFFDLKVDFRAFKSLGKKLIVGNQFITQVQVGTAPFQVTPTFGGLDKMRGYRNGQYRDRLFVMNQTELRFPIYKRVSGTVFAGMGNVWDSLGHMSFNGIKFAAGAGLRFRINDAKINLRGDGAITRNGKLGYYLTSIEAF